MQALLEFAPLIAFFAGYYTRGLYFATGLLMVTMPLLLGVAWLRTRTLPRMQLLSCVLVLVFGTATLVLRNAEFIKWKPTIFLWIVAVVLLGWQLLGREPLIKRLFAAALGDRSLPEATWRRINVLWAAFYAALGLANIVVARHFSESAWVNFKVIGLTALILVFSVAQVLWISSRTAVADAR
jgi:intracellular septation protein